MSSRNMQARVGALVLVAIGLFIYMGFQLGSFAIDTGRYQRITLQFADSGGLSRKAEVKIAGVQVGWVESINLILYPHTYAKVTILVSREHALREGVQAVIKQDGLLGPKFIELRPGHGDSKPLEDNSEVPKSMEVASVDELFLPLKNCAKNIQVITQTLQQTMATQEAQQDMLQMRHDMVHIMSRVAECVEKVTALINRHEQNVDALLHAGAGAQELVSQAQTVCNQAHMQLQAVDTMVQRINDGTGTIGKLITNSDMYDNLNRCVAGARGCVDWLANASYGFDAHLENMVRKVQPLCIKDAKGYFTSWIQPSAYYFFLFQIIASEHGYVSRTFEETNYFTGCGCPVDVNQLDLTDGEKLEHVFDREVEKIKRNKVTFGLQFGFLYKWFALRVGIFEGTAGVATDLNIPLDFIHTHLLSTVELFDFRGLHSRLCCNPDRVPHLKWLNRLYFFENFYVALGLDDIASSCNHSFFAGLGVQFIT